MLSYRHHFHAGNAADVLKHIVLIHCLEYLMKKEKPLLCVDTHAGAGAYRLSPAGTGVNREWENGLGRLLARGPSPERQEMPAPAARYLELIRAMDGMYPGSPLLMGKLLRAQDRLVCFELHPRDFEELRSTVGTFVPAPAGKGLAVEVRRENGPLSLKALLPPSSRRGLVFIDPPWEEKDEYETIPQATALALKRFSQGTYIIWYPLLAKPKAPPVPVGSPGETLLRLFPGNRCRVELYSPPGGTETNSPRGMYGSGLAIFNPPWTLRPAMEETLPFLARIFAVKARGNEVPLPGGRRIPKEGWKLEWWNL